MRITNKMLSDNYLSDMRINLNNMQTLQKQLSTGKNFTKPSEDPFNVAKTMKMQTAINVNTQYNKNITDSGRWLDTTDTALGQLGTVFQNIRTKLLSAGNAAYGSDEREKIKDAINENIGQISQILNTNFGGEYIFAGTRATSKPTNALTDSTIGSVTCVTTGGAGTVSGTYYGSEGTTQFKIQAAAVSGSKVTKVNVLKSTDGGTTFTSVASNVSPGGDGTFNIGNGLSFAIADDTGNTVNTSDPTKSSTYTFNCESSGNTRLVYTDDAGNELKDLPEVTSQKVTAANWNSATITFNIDGADKAITLDPTLATVDDVVSSINGKIKVNADLKGKVMAEKTDDGQIKFVTLDKDKVTIKSTTLGSSEFDSTLLNSEIPNIQMDMISSKRKTEVSQGVLTEYNVTASELINYGDSSKDNIISLLSRIVNHLDGKDDTGNANETTATNDLANEDLADVDNALKQILKVRSQVGAKSNAMDSAEKQNEEDSSNMTEILSKTEDIDVTEKVMDFATMQTVYLAALQTSSKVLQPTLMDYLT